MLLVWVFGCCVFGLICGVCGVCGIAGGDF